MKNIIRSLFATSLLLVSIAGISQTSTPPSAETLLKEASKTAAKEKKQVFVMFHASWCSWCHKMDTLLSKPAVSPLIEKNYVVKHIVVQEAPAKKNLETPGGLELLTKYNGDKQGIPFWVILDKNGKLLADSRVRKEGSDTPGDNTGCPATKEEIEYFVKTLKTTSSLTDDQLKTIANTFGEIRNIKF